MELEFSPDLTISLVRKSDHEWEVNDTRIEADLVSLSADGYHLLMEGRSYRVFVESVDPVEKIISLVVNGSRVVIRARGRYEALLASLGMSAQLDAKAKDLKAPMPGLVLEVPVKVGQEVSEGESLIILEAMKMENVIKATAQGRVKEIKVKTSDSVEKNQVLITFDA